MNWNAEHEDGCSCKACRARETVVQDTELSAEDLSPLAGSGVKEKWYAAMVEDADDARNDSDDEYVITPWDD